MWYEEGEDEGSECFSERKYLDADESSIVWEMGSLCLCS